FPGKAGSLELRVHVANAGGVAGFALKLGIKQKGGRTKYVVTDSSWTAAIGKSAKSPPVRTLGKMGDKPWGDVFSQQVAFVGGQRNIFQTLPGFQVERIFTVPKAKLGSWVSITTDNKGRLIVSDQGNKGLCRVTPPKIGSNEKTKVERLNIKISSAHGMLYAFGSLYLSINGGPGSGLYRARDTNGDDQFDEVIKLKSFRGAGEHGPHALRLSPDGKSIYIVCGNHTDPPANLTHKRLAPKWGEDLLLPRQWDARGHARGKLAPGGWVAKTDPDGKTWEIISNGYRNSYDMAFNADGELFVYDADMEWDFGSPWYRPTRVVHATSGSEFGWRSGTGKWPTHYIDSLPPVINIGPGSPVGVEFGYGAKFPAKYQKALFICDWTFGTMYAIHLTPDGASYKATKEEFLSRTPLPLTDVVIGKDGAMYFLIGGRGIDSELFRVTYVGKESTAKVDYHDKRNAELRTLRHRLERYHMAGKGRLINSAEVVSKALGHRDRHIRYAARVALEHLPEIFWEDRVLNHHDPAVVIQGAVALARVVRKSLQPKLLSVLSKLDFGKLTESQKLDLLRVYQLSFIRQAAPDEKTAAALAKKLDAFYPSKSDVLNRELCRMLVYLKSPTVIAKTIALMKQKSKSTAVMTPAELLARSQRYGPTIAKMQANRPDEQKTHYAFMLRNLRKGWTTEQRIFYFRWLAQAATKSGGASYQGFMRNMGNDAYDNASDSERLAIEASGARKPVPLPPIPKTKGPGRNWTLAEVIRLSNTKLKNRSFANGRKIYAATRCVVCHRFAGQGGATGPDLTQLAGRFNIKALAEAIVDPSKVVSDQYRGSIVVTTKGKTLIGRILTRTDKVLTILTDPENSTKVVTVPAGEIDEVTVSKISLMPKDLLKTCNENEVLDLMAYLLSRGNPNDAMFRRR
ncbi:MAG: c-type cytochrome, partial [Planctomycetes bacterium]|nr:c-type cytochrome [Planctomycetota bacterium]